MSDQFPLAQRLHSLSAPHRLHSLQFLPGPHRVFGQPWFVRLIHAETGQWTPGWGQSPEAALSCAQANLAAGLFGLQAEGVARGSRASPRGSRPSRPSRAPGLEVNEILARIGPKLGPQRDPKEPPT